MPCQVESRPGIVAVCGYACSFSVPAAGSASGGTGLVILDKGYPIRSTQGWRHPVVVVKVDPPRNLVRCATRRIRQTFVSCGNFRVGKRCEKNPCGQSGQNIPWNTMYITHSILL